MRKTRCRTETALLTGRLARLENPLENPYAESDRDVVQPLLWQTYRQMAVVTIVVDLTNADGDMLARDYVQATAKLPGPAVSTRSKTTEVTAADQDMDERLEFTLLGPRYIVHGRVVMTRTTAGRYSLSEAWPNQIREQVSAGSGDSLGRVGYVSFHGEPLFEVTAYGPSEAV